MRKILSIIILILFICACASPSNTEKYRDILNGEWHLKETNEKLEFKNNEYYWYSDKENYNKGSYNIVANKDVLEELKVSLDEARLLLDNNELIIEDLVLLNLNSNRLNQNDETISLLLDMKSDNDKIIAININESLSYTLTKLKK